MHSSHLVSASPPIRCFFQNSIWYPSYSLVWYFSVFHSPFPNPFFICHSFRSFKIHPYVHQHSLFNFCFLLFFPFNFRTTHLFNFKILFHFSVLSSMHSCSFSYFLRNPYFSNSSVLRLSNRPRRCMDPDIRIHVSHGTRLPSRKDHTKTFS